MNGKTKTALVTGANRGIGRAIAAVLSEHDGIRVIAAARTPEDAEATAKELGGDTVGVALDLTEPLSISSQAATIEEEHGAIDILVNNAGVLLPGAAGEADESDLEEALHINAVAPFGLIRAFGPAMRDRGWGRIVNMSSGWGSFEEGLTGPATYSISKATLNAVTVTYAQALGRAVKVNAACPGWVRTRMGGLAAGRSPEQGAETPVWLATLPDNGPTGGFFRDRHLIEW